MDAFIASVALPTMARDLHASASQIEAAIAVYFMAYATLIITCRRLCDIHGAKRVLIAGIAGFALASLTLRLPKSDCNWRALVIGWEWLTTKL